MPPAVVIRPQTSPAQQRRAAPRQFAVVGERLGEAHGDSGPERSREPDEERVPRHVRRESGGEHRRQGGNRAVHQSDQAGLDDLQDEAAARLLVLVRPSLRSEYFGLERLGAMLVFVLLLGEIAEQLANACVAGAIGGQAIETRRVQLHIGRQSTDFVDAERANLPDRLALNIAANVVATNERDVLAELRDEEIDEAPAMSVLLSRHFGEDFRGRRVTLAHALRDVGVDPAVFLFVADGQRHELSLGKISEFTHARGPLRRDEFGREP